MDEELQRWKEQLKDLSWRKIVWWSHRDLCRLGIDLINLLCALGLPGAEEMDIDYCLHKIDRWAEKVQFYTAQMTHVFERNPGRYGNSLAYFKALCLITVLQRDCGVKYNLTKRSLDVPLEVADSFIFGIIQGEGGTCASLPVLYCAVGHHLGYPMFLVHAKGEYAQHVYVRWDDGEIRFNIEATGEGMGTPTDDHYRTGQFEVTPQIEKDGCFLKPLNMRQSLATFVAERARYCMDQKAFLHAVDAMGWAVALHPENRFYVETAKIFWNRWNHYLLERMPPRFPRVSITRIEKRRFPETVPLKFELDICCLEAIECLLGNAHYQASLWDPMRRGMNPPRVPIEAKAQVKKDRGKTIQMVFEDERSHYAGGSGHV